MLNKDELNQLYRYALSLSGQEASAYDLLQSAIERYLKVSSQDIDVPIAFIKTTIRNLFYDMQRHHKVVPMLSMNSDDLASIEPMSDDSMDDVLINQQEVKILMSCLNAEESELLYLWAVEEYTVDEIARMYEKPRGTLLSKLHRLKKRIRAELHDSDLNITRINKGKR